MVSVFSVAEECVCLTGGLPQGLLYWPQGMPPHFLFLKMWPKGELQGSACLFYPSLLNKNSAGSARLQLFAGAQKAWASILF